jgi:signal peptidase
MKSAVRMVGWLLDAALVLLVALVLALVLAANVGPLLGHEPLVIRGGSMAPAIPRGALVDVARVEPAELAVGDVVTIKAANGVLVTHRVSRIVEMPDGLYLETKGDANGQPDPALVPVSAVTGRVDLSLPYLGYVMYMLTTPAGLVSVVCLAFSLLLAIWLLEDLQGDDGDLATRAGTAPPVGELLIG